MSYINVGKHSNLEWIRPKARHCFEFLVIILNLCVEIRALALAGRRRSCAGHGDLKFGL